MKKLMAFAVVAAMAGTTYAASLQMGTREVAVEGYLDPATSAGTTYNLNLKYGQFVQDNLEVGGEVSWYDDDADTLYGAGVFGEYNFDQGTEIVPFVGASLDYVNDQPDKGDSQDAVVASGAVGVKYFLVDNVAISLSGKYQLASDNIYWDKQDQKDYNVEIDLGMRFFLPEGAKKAAK